MDSPSATPASTHTDIRVTQNGKTRNYITQVTELLSQGSIDDNAAGESPNHHLVGTEQVVVTLSAYGRCISKLVSIVEVTKSLIHRELHQYNAISTVDTKVENHVDDDDENVENDVITSTSLKSQMSITLSTHVLVDFDVNVGTCYQHHNPASLHGDSNATTQKSTHPGMTNNGSETGGNKTGSRSRRHTKGKKKKDIEDAKNVLF